jgi:predicted MFS family arabinose efflux permease
MRRSLVALAALNFFMADVRDGLGPFLGVFLQSKDWSPSQIGLVMTIGGLAAMAATAPLGMLVDNTRAKRGMIVIAALAIVISSMAILFAPNSAVTGLSQVISGVCGAVIGPAIAAITLGLVRQAGYAHQLGRNEAFNHAGNVAAAVLAGGFGYFFGLGAVFVVMSAMAFGAIVAVMVINPDEIDHRAARGLSDDPDQKVAALSVLLTSKPLLILGATLTLFHLGNAAMLPLLGQSLVARGAADASASTSATIIVAQLTMIPMALLAARLAEQRGYWIVFLLALIALPLRGALAAWVTGSVGLVPVQILDGVGAGMLGVAVPGLVARIMAGTGHVNAALGVVMTLQGVGAALSPTLGGIVAERLGYSASFLVLGGVAAIALVLWVLARPVTAQACGDTPARIAPAGAG